eukprot:453884_1
MYKLCKDINYYPIGNVYVYDEKNDEIIFVGGKNKKNNENYNCIIIYNIKKNTTKQLILQNVIGWNPTLILTDTNVLHIVGGSKNNLHIMYNLFTKESISIDLLDTEKFRQNHGLIYHKKTNTIMIFGGWYSKTSTYFDDFCSIQLNNKYNLKWETHSDRKMLTKLSGFGYVLYKDRILITFGGQTENFKLIDTIYYIDLQNNNSWKQSKLKCPKPGFCNAVIINEIIQIFPNGSYCDHFSVNISDIIPLNLWQNHIDIIDEIKLNNENKCNRCDELDEKIQTLMEENKMLHIELERMKQTNKELKEKINILNIKFELPLDLSKYEEWNGLQVIDWIMSLENNRFKQYEEILKIKFIQQDFDGSCIKDVEKSDISEWGIANFKDKTTMFKHIKYLISQTQCNVNRELNEGIYNTDYI